MLISWKTTRQFQILFRSKKRNHECDNYKTNGGKITRESSKIDDKLHLVP